MGANSLFVLFSDLSTPLVADACLRLGLSLRLAPPGIRPIRPDLRLAGRVLPVRHYGSVDVFLEALGGAQPGDVMVVDNGGRSDEGCIGDLIALEAQAAGMVGMAVWGFHRDTPELERVGLPVFSYGTCPAGPQRLDEQEPDALDWARFGEWVITSQDTVFGDADGLLFLPAAEALEVLEIARSISDREREQAVAVRSGTSLREQLQFEAYLARRGVDPAYTFRRHLRDVSGAVEA